MISILIIGNEILSAQVVDFNLKYMLPKLAKAGYPVDEVRIVRDSLETIVNAIKVLSHQSEFLISTGGIGPTHDDLTLKAYAQAFDSPLQSNPDLVAKLKAHFGGDLKKDKLRHAILPACAELIAGADKTWPLVKVKNCFVLPGLPEAFLKKFPSVLQALPKLPTWHFAAIMVANRETDFAAALAQIQNTYPGVEIGSYPNWHRQDYRAKITLKSRDLEAIHQVFSRTKTLIEGLNGFVAEVLPQPYDPQKHSDSFQQKPDNA